MLCYHGMCIDCPPRMSLTNMIQTLAPVISLNMIRDSILPILEKLVTDPIPNIRFNVAKSYAVLIDTLRNITTDGTITAPKGSSASSKGEDLITKSVVPSLEKLQQDDDVDVRYFATIANGGGPNDAMETS